jgi:hypothetical protein
MRYVLGEFRAALAVPCPFCSRAAQRPCVQPNGRQLQQPHSARVRAYRDKQRRQ